ncbi:MAG: UvrD-helicase domain-containing protein [Acidimicrobiales bacterium]
MSATTATAGGPPQDQDQRDRIANELDHTLFVEAGAGSGKSTALVGRVLQLVVEGEVPLRNIAAITFTEKAAAELRDRIRQKLEVTAAAARAAEDHATLERCEDAIDQLDGAAIGTLHAFAQRILAENPIEVQLPPRLDILDEVTSDVLFEQRWTTYLDHLLADPEMQETLLLMFAAGVKHQALRAMAVEFDANWDLVEARVPDEMPPLPKLLEHAAPAIAALDAVCSRIDECSADDDAMRARLGELADYARALRELDDDIDLLEELTGSGALARPSFKVGRTGRATNWPDLPAVRDEIRQVDELFQVVAGRVAQACAHRVAVALRRFTLAGAQARRDAGQLAFHDLLVLARQLVATNPDVRDRLHRRYQRLLLDEFQDTDPIQIEIAVRIAAADPRSPEAGAPRWQDVPVAPGHLFFVGDPKQSIYRFRRADISLFLAAAHRYGAEGGRVTLATNFRTGHEIIDWVNRTFAELLAEAPELDVEAEAEVESQPPYEPLLPHRPSPSPDGGPSVSVIGRQPLHSKARAPELRAAEARQVAATVARIQADRWQVADGDGWRPARLGDITILVPARTSLPFLEDELERLAIPYRAESSSLVYVSRAVRDLLMALRAVDDPSNHLAIVAALRSPLFGCGDDDLFTFKVLQRGHWNYLAPQPDTVADGPVAAGLAYLRELHDLRHWASPAELADRIARDRRLFELGFAEGRTRDVWRRLRFVIDQAREWGEATDGTLREYLLWVARQSAEGSRVAEAVLPETDDDAVRIMTIHAAKGLEFPITILSGMSTAPMTRRSPAQVVFPPAGGVGYRFGSNVQTDEFVDWMPIDDQMAYDERVRLLYVACTRAKDHLIVSVQRKERSAPPAPSSRSNAEILVAGMGQDVLDALPDAVDDQVEAPAVTVAAPPPAPTPYPEWRAALDAALRAGARPTTVAATALTAEGEPDVARDELLDEVTEDPVGPGDAADGPGQGTLPFDAPAAPSDTPTAGAPEPRTDGQEVDPEQAQPAEAGLQKRPRDLDLPPWLKGRYGTAVGRAVHGTLQTIDLATAEGLAGAVAAQCEAEAIVERAPEVEALVRAALASPVVAAAAASGAAWREVYACTPITAPNGTTRLLEGYIDLLYRGPEGMVVVDYKTAATNDPAELARRVEGYRLQGAAYALAVGRTTGEPVDRVCFAFLTPQGAVELDLDDLPAAIAEVESLVTAGSEREAS